jgi:hypothetical protein
MLEAVVGREQAHFECDGPLTNEKMSECNNHYKKCLDVMKNVYDTTPGTPGGELYDLIKDCCDSNIEQRPPLKEVIRKSEAIAKMQ